MNSSYTPQAEQENVSRFGARLGEILQYFYGQLKDSDFPEWVLKMGRAFKEQALSAKAIKALDEWDEEFLAGLFTGAMIALRRCAPDASEDQDRLAVSAGREVVRKMLPETPESEFPESIRGFVENSEMQQMISKVFSEIHEETQETRTKFLEGAAEGSKLEEFMRNGSMRPGLAHDTQFTMLLFWPELESMKTRTDACRFLELLYKDMPMTPWSEESLLRLMKDYGFKKQKKRKSMRRNKKTTSR